MSEPSRKEMKEVLQNPRTDSATRERYAVLYREAFMRDLQGMIRAWGDLPRKSDAVQLLEDCDNNIKLTITALIEGLSNGDEAIPGPG